MGVVMATGGSDPPCLDAAASVGEIWHASARETAREGLIAHGGVFGADAWSRAEDSLQVYIDAIAAARTEACEATHVRREQSPQLQDLQVACLDRRLHDVKVLLEVFARANTEVSTRAVSAVGNLEPVETCSRQALAQDVFEPLPDEGTRTLRTEIDRARVLESTAQYDEAMDVVRAASRTVERQGSPALVLELEYRRGRLQDRLGDHEAAIETLSQVHWEAEALGLDDVAAQAAVGVVYDLAAVAHRTDEALVWAPHARAAIERAGGDEALRATLLENIGTAHLYGQAHEEALRMYEEALVIRERRASEEPLGLLSILGSMGVLLEEMHRYEEAKQVQERALALSKLTVGDQHPHTGRSHDNLGTVLMRLERHAEAIEELGIGLDIRRNALGERHPLVGLSYGHLGLTWLLSGEGEKAVDAYERALSIVEEANAADARIVLQTREGLAHALVLAGRSAEAEPHARAALEGLRAQLGEAHPEVEGLAALLTEIAAGPQ
jgi:tetratricopeptide (TPR) repeat protein